MTIMPAISIRQPWAWAMPGQWHWVLADARPLPFWPCKGRLGIFKVEYPHELSTAL